MSVIWLQSVSEPAVNSRRKHVSKKVTTVNCPAQHDYYPHKTKIASSYPPVATSNTYNRLPVRPIRRPLSLHSGAGVLGVGKYGKRASANMGRVQPWFRNFIGHKTGFFLLSIVRVYFYFNSTYPILRHKGLHFYTYILQFYFQHNRKFSISF